MAQGYTSGDPISTDTGLSPNSNNLVPSQQAVKTYVDNLTNPVSLAHGGTNANLAASNGGIFYSTAAAGAILSGTATAGQILRSGSSAAPSWSTATYPSTAGTSGKILVSDGTNIVSSTPTFPNASATTRKIIVSDGTNWVASTETYATPGTSANLMTSDGTNWTSAAPTIYSVTTPLTNSQIKNLHGTPIQVLAAPGAGKVYVVVSAIGKLLYGGSNVFTAGASQTINYAYGTANSVVILTNALITSSASKYGSNASTTITNVAIASLENTALNLYNPISTEISGNAANNNTMNFTILYYIVSL